MGVAEQDTKIPDERPPRRSRRKLALFLSALALALALYLYVRNVLPPRIVAAQAQTRNLVQTVVATGNVVPQNRVDLAAQVAAEVESVFVQEGDEVRRDELLITLRADELQAQVEEARALILERQAQLNELLEVGRSEAIERLQRAERALEEAEDEWQRAQALFDVGGISRVQLEQIQRAHDDAQAAVELAQTQLKAQQAGGSTRQRLMSELARAQASLDAAQARFAHTRIVSPMHGAVTAVRVDPGDTVQPGALLLAITEGNPTEIVIEPDETSLPWLEEGQTGLASADAFPADSFPVTVRSVVPAVDPERGTVEVRLMAPQPPAYLVSDMTVSVDIVVRRVSDAVVVPRAAVFGVESPQPLVWLIDNGRVAARRVQIGARDAQYIEITTGISPGDIVAMQPANVRPGDRVRVRWRGDST